TGVETSSMTSTMVSRARSPKGERAGGGPIFWTASTNHRRVRGRPFELCRLVSIRPEMGAAVVPSRGFSGGFWGWSGAATAPGLLRPGCDGCGPWDKFWLRDGCAQGTSRLRDGCARLQKLVTCAVARRLRGAKTNKINGCATVAPARSCFHSGFFELQPGLSRRKWGASVRGSRQHPRHGVVAGDPICGDQVELGL